MPDGHTDFARIQIPGMTKISGSFYCERKKKKRKEKERRERKGKEEEKKTPSRPAQIVDTKVRSWCSLFVTPSISLVSDQTASTDRIVQRFLPFVQPFCFLSVLAPLPFLPLGQRTRSGYFFLFLFYFIFFLGQIMGPLALLVRHLPPSLGLFRSVGSWHPNT